MTREDKNLLLKDLCARLPYGVRCCVYTMNREVREDNEVLYDIMSLGENVRTLKLLNSNPDECLMIYQVKPYLRPMSSMTEDEKEELYQKTGFKIDDYILGLSAIDWLNAHHFDYRGLIEKGLALEATEDMYK